MESDGELRLSRPPSELLSGSDVEEDFNEDLFQTTYFGDNLDSFANEQAKLL